MKGKMAATLVGGVAATLFATAPALAGDVKQATSPAGVAPTSASADRPCSWRDQKLYFMGEREANFGGTGIVTILNCHATKRNAGIDVARGPDPDCKKIPFGETREFEYHKLKDIAEYRKPKWC